MAMSEISLPLDHLFSGKVRETFLVDDDLLLMVTTDRISAFDVVLPTPIPDKGRVLNQMSAMWFKLTQNLVPNHLVALATDEWLRQSEFARIHGLRDILAPVVDQAMIVTKAQRIDIECIVRGYITGSAWSEYQKHGTVSGQQMPSGMVEGDPFPEPLFTPTTKADEGHDENMTAEEVIALVGPDLARQLEEVTKTVYDFGRKYALRRGIVLADTKMEFGLIRDPSGRGEDEASQLILIDELLTPDSSRFWDASQYKPGSSPPSFDKQFVRDWLTEQGWDKKPPAPELPPEIVAKTSERYQEAQRLLSNQ